MPWRLWCRDVTVLMVQQEGAERSCHMKRLTRADADSTSVTISVEEGVPGTALAVSTHRLLCMRTVLQVGRWTQGGTDCEGSS